MVSYSLNQKRRLTELARKFFAWTDTLPQIDILFEKTEMKRMKYRWLKETHKKVSYRIFAPHKKRKKELKKKKK